MTASLTGSLQHLGRRDHSAERHALPAKTCRRHHAQWLGLAPTANGRKIALGQVTSKPV